MEAEVSVDGTDDCRTVAHGCGHALHRPLPEVARGEHSIHRGLVWQARPLWAWRDSHVGQYGSQMVCRVAVQLAPAKARP
jgi:hypothetical protein